MTDTAWIASYPRSGADRLRFLLAAYLLMDRTSTPDLNALREVVPDFVRLFSRGRELPMDGSGPVAAKTLFKADAEVLRQYRPTEQKVVYLVRDPRDMILSTLRFLGIPEAERATFAKNCIAQRGVVPQWRNLGRGDWVEHVRAWTGIGTGTDAATVRGPVKVVRYEELHRDPAATLSSVVDFLGIGDGADRDRAARAAAYATPETAFEALRAEIASGVKALRRNAVPSFRPMPPDSGTLADFGDDVEAEYRRLLAEDEEFAECVSRYGYADANSAV